MVPSVYRQTFLRYPFLYGKGAVARHTVVLQQGVQKPHYFRAETNVFKN
ncbi:MAG: hypothetical protein KCHDKBKB_01576 [Elusimicrobia bacterium]|nr:hypothetical protein [Elusimicrobiota bacterium]